MTPTGLSVVYSPNALGQATQAGSYATGVQYHPNGAIKQFTYGNGVVHTMTQNARQMPMHSVDSGGVHSLSYNYDQAGNVSSIIDNLDSNRNRWLGYDALDRLTLAGSVSFGGDHWHRFAYDAFDNLTSWTLAGVKGFATYEYNAANRLTGIRNSGGALVHQMGYDVQGNLSSKDANSFNFGYGNRLRWTNGPSGYEGYRYDAYGRRVQAWTPAANVLSIYSQSGQLMYQENGRKQAGVEHIYLAGSLVAVTERPFTTWIPTIHYQHTDALGSPVATTNQAGTVIDRTSYEPYGKPIGETLDGVGYTGHVMDPVSGLVYMQQRYYDPVIGRFLSVDPVMASAATGRNFNRYLYTDNNPYRYTDPDGRYRCIGSKKHCARIKAYVEAIRRAARKPPRGTSREQRDELRNISKYLGTENDDAGPTITVGPLDGNSIARTSQKGSWVFDVEKAEGKDNSLVRGAMAAVHEGKHDVDSSQVGYAKNVESEVRARETSAYRIQAVVGTSEGFKMSEADIQAAIDGSVESWRRELEKKEQP